IVLFVIFSITGCNNNNSEKFGKNITEKRVIEVKEIFSNPEKFINQTFTLEGKIVRECPSGCWFYLEDNTGKIFVDINPSGLSIPQRVGKKVTVEGELKRKDGRIIFIGKGVEIK
ncbi:hypothetical protein KKI11_03090, partial [bacterium]|nr:hypothetical protein [bacterium]